jgi:hypothetical protein
VDLSELTLIRIDYVPGRKFNHNIGNSKQKLYIIMCPNPNDFRDRATSLYRRATRHALTRAAKCTDVDGGIIKKLLY